MNLERTTYRVAHDATFRETSKEEKLADYAKWAPGYDEHAKKGRYIAHETCVSFMWKKLQECNTVATGSTAGPNNSSEMRVLDAGCGTGLCAVHIREFAKDLDRPVHIIGVDYSKDMMVHAEERGVYDELLLADLNVQLELNGGPVDLLVAAGVFLEGHCGPATIYPMMKSLKEGGIASISFRRSVFLRDEAEYMQSFEKAGCDVIENVVTSYARDGEILGNYILLKKRQS